MSQHPLNASRVGIFVSVYDAERALAIDTLVGLTPMFAPTKRGGLVRLNLNEKEGRSEE
jgi:hypothetical protein